MRINSICWYCFRTTCTVVCLRKTPFVTDMTGMPVIATHNTTHNRLLDTYLIQFAQFLICARLCSSPFVCSTWPQLAGAEAKTKSGNFGRIQNGQEIKWEPSNHRPWCTTLHRSAYALSLFVSRTLTLGLKWKARLAVCSVTLWYFHPQWSYSVTTTITITIHTTSHIQRSDTRTHCCQCHCRCGLSGWRFAR